MTTSRTSDANQTPGPPGFRVFGAGNGSLLGRFGQIFNALKISAGWRSPGIFNALKIDETRGRHASNRGGPAMQIPK
jgi:hypothetical protein